jgi:hypothetical protein
MMSNLKKCCQVELPMDMMEFVKQELSKASTKLTESQYSMIQAYSSLYSYKSSDMETMLEVVTEKVNMGLSSLMMADMAVESADDMTEYMDRMVESMMLTSSSEMMSSLQSFDDEVEMLDSLLHSLDQMVEATLSMVSSIKEMMKVTF